MAQESEAFVSVINPDDLRFLPLGDMPKRVREFCRDTGQPVPESMGETVRCVLDSLALRYRSTAEDLEEVVGKPIRRINIVGGGTQNKLLCQLTANATGRPVIAGPIEATAIGNVLVQAMGAGLLSSLAEVREIVKNSFEMDTYQPKTSPAIERAYERFKQIETGS
jgi:rhamnulokinase